MIYLLVVPAIEINTCGEPPVIPNGKLTARHIANRENSTVAVTCEEGFFSEVQHFICKSGEWNSGVALTDVCKRESLVSYKHTRLTGTVEYILFLFCFFGLTAADPEYCGAPPRVENAVVITQAKLFPPNSEVTYLCRQNFNLQGDATSRCNNGQWEMNLMCKRKYYSLSCSALSRCGSIFPF